MLEEAKSVAIGVATNIIYIYFSFSNAVAVEAEKSVATRVVTKHYFIYSQRATTVESAKVGCDCRDNSREKNLVIYKKNWKEKML